jgi:hypothetical protein
MESMITESFKKLDEVTEADPRSDNWVRVSQDGIASRFDLGEHHRFLEPIVLDPLVPENIRDQFMTAKHLALYAWFVYRFHMTANLQAFASLEYALRERLIQAIPRATGTKNKNARRPVRPTLKVLLTQAIESGLVDNVTVPGRPESELDRESYKEWLRRLPAVLTDQRNRLAHGSFELMPTSGWTLLVVAEIINKLYRNAGTPAPELMR